MLERMNDQPLRLLLSGKHKAFADAYIATGNASESARRAGYSSQCAGVTGHKLLRRPDVQEYLANMTAKVHEAEEEDLRDRVNKELSTLAFANIADFISIDDDGTPRVDLSNATPEQLRAIASVKSKTRKIYNKEGEHIATETESAFAMSDKYRGLELIGKTLGMFKADEQRLVVDVADRLLAARGRLRRLESDDSEKFG